MNWRRIFEYKSLYIIFALHQFRDKTPLISAGKYDVVITFSVYHVQNYLGVVISIVGLRNTLYHFFFQIKFGYKSSKNTFIISTAFFNELNKLQCK